MTIKKIHGKPLSGSSWIDLVQIYVQTINEGGVPNIESSWTYICKQRAQVKLAEAIQSFEREVA
jgi:hypothetical protein